MLIALAKPDMHNITQNQEQRLLYKYKSYLYEFPNILSINHSCQVFNLCLSNNSHLHTCNYASSQFPYNFTNYA